MRQSLFMFMVVVIGTSLGAAEANPAGGKLKVAPHPQVEAISAARRALDDAERKFNDANERGGVPDGPEADPNAKPLAQLKTEVENARTAYRAALAAARDAAVPGATAALDARETVARKVVEMQTEADTNLVAVALERLAGLPMADVTLSEDPTRSEMQRAERAKAFNRIISGVQDRARSKRVAANAVYLDRLLSDPETLALLAEFSAR